MEFRQIEHFLKLYQIQNMTKASEALFISQQGLSRSIKNLEDELQLTLFNKSQRGAIPTTQAEALKPFFESLLQNKNRLFSQAEKLQNASQEQPINIVCGFDYQYSPISSLFKAFNTAFPNIQLHFIPMAEKDRINALSSGKCSYALMDSPRTNEQIVSLGILHREAYVAAMNIVHPLSHYQKFTWELAQDMNIALADKGSKLEKDITFNLNQTQVFPNQLFSLENVLDIIPKILEERFIGIMPKEILKYFDKTNLVLLPIEPPMIQEIHLITLKTLSPTPSERQFSDFFKAFLAEKVFSE